MMGARRTAMGSLAMMALLAVWPHPAHPDMTRDIKVTKIDGKAPADFVADRIGKSWAVVIGIDEYEKAPKLKYARADAKAVAGALARQGFQVRSLYDEQATRSNILGALGDTLVDQVGEQDRVLIYFAGHGETKKAKGGRTTGYLVPVGGEAAVLAQTAISMSMIRDLSEALPAKHVLFLIDVCYGGIAGTLGRSMPPMTESYLREITRERGRQLITAGGPDQRALEGPEWGHSVFTYYLLEGLEKGLADLNEDGIIPASELYAYLDARVFGAAALKGHVQRPERWDLAAEKGEFVFFTSAGGLAPAKPVPVPSAALSQAEQELKALQEQERQVEEQERLAALQTQIEAKKQQVEEKKKKIELAKAYDLPKQTGREITGKDGAPMVLVPAGEFLYGDDNQRLSLPAFYMDKYEVSTRLYSAFLQATSRAQPSDWSQQVALVGSGDRPVVNVTWHDADAYCRHYEKRLPTEQEWEMAARGTDGRKYPWGNEEPTRRHALFDTTWNGYGTLAVVGSHEAGASPYGIQDLAGNVSEWTSSNVGNDKVFRGGSWSNGPVTVRSADRGWDIPTSRYALVGFRCAQDAREEKENIEVASLPSYNAPKQRGHEITGKDGAPMVLVSEGEFLYGNDKQRLSLRAFYMDKYEVTTKLYAAFMKAYGKGKPKYWEDVKLPGDEELPVIGVKWADAVDYCRYYGKRLPTEQEWEKAARGTEGPKFPWGNEQPTPNLANYVVQSWGDLCGPFCNAYEEKLKPVNSYAGGQSPYGIFNLAGNVAEWTSSENDAVHMVVRGGSWALPPDWLGGVNRMGIPPRTRDKDLGFRCAQDAR